MFKFIKQLFCKHKYKYRFLCTHTYKDYYEGTCVKCNKKDNRVILHENDDRKKVINL